MRVLTITEALKALQAAEKDAPRFEIVLACGFTPLHLQTLLAAHTQKRLPNRRVTVRPGLFGSAVIALEQALEKSADGIAVVLEWPDLDPRLGFREATPWSIEMTADIARNVALTLERVHAALQRTPRGLRVALSLPSLRIPPVFHTCSWQTSEPELLIDEAVAAFAVSAGRLRNVSVLNSRRLGEISPYRDRYDLKSDLLTSLPYALPHADALAGLMASLLTPAVRKKGIITDLDNTLWHGIVGEIGPYAVSWDLTSHHRLHGLYQSMLQSLAEAGVLVAVASKNDQNVVKQTFDQRDDLLLRADRVFPMEVHWNAKSGSIDRILKTWNISADTVVFVDDSPMELAEVKAAHPGIECRLFSGSDYAAMYGFLQELRDMYGKERLSEEDALRVDSIRRSAAIQTGPETAGATSEDFLRAAGAALSVEWNPPAEDGRVLELVNKTNQFNLNGIRYTEGEWHGTAAMANVLVSAIAYEDRFGKLGKVSVLRGRHKGDRFVVDTWVLSCRAFARRIEHSIIKVLFNRLAVREIAFEFTPTPKNGPIRDFLTAICGREPEGEVVLERATFENNCPSLYHETTEVERGLIANG
jgi:FkbH-like protein